MANLAPSRPQALLITPIVPAPTGNGLAMRAALAVEGLTRCCDLWTAVVPVSDPGIDEARMSWVAERCVRAVVIEPEQSEDAVTGWLGDPAAREVVTSAQPLPVRARRASPRSGVAATKQLGRDSFDVIWVLRLYLAGTIASFLAPRTQLMSSARARLMSSARARLVSPARARLILDSDDDDEATLRAIADLHRLRGDVLAAENTKAEAAAYGRLAGACLPWFDQIFTASPVDARTLAVRHGLENIATLPNAVNLGPKSLARSSSDPNFIFVGNFDYLPNLDAAERLSTTLMPVIRRELPGAQLHLVGAGGGSRIEQLGRETGVTAHGPVDDLTTLYRRADLTLVPLRAGGGSRLKILEAFANGIPVVATPEAAEGLDVSGGEELALGSSDDELVSATVRIVRDAGVAADLATRGRGYVSDHHELNTVAQDLANRVVKLVEA